MHACVCVHYIVINATVLYYATVAYDFSAGCELLSRENKIKNDAHLCKLKPVMFIVSE